MTKAGLAEEHGSHEAPFRKYPDTHERATVAEEQVIQLGLTEEQAKQAPLER